MNHKRKRPKSGRAGCLLCKPHKRQGSKIEDRDRPTFLRRNVDAKQQVAELSS